MGEHPTSTTTASRFSLSSIATSFLTIMSNVMTVAGEMSDAMGNGSVDPPADIHWGEPTPVKWVEGGYELSDTELNATTTPPDLALVYDPPKGRKLGPGDAKLQVRLADTVQMSAKPVGVTLKVEKTAATIAWDAPSEVEWTEGGFTPGATQLNAKTTPPDLKLTYSWTPQGPLAPGSHKLLASLDPSGPYEAKPAEQTLVVQRPPSGLTWDNPPAVPYVPKGVVLGAAQLDTVKNPKKIEVEFDPKAGVALQPGKHKLTVRATEASMHDTKPVEVEFEVTKVQATIAWTKPKAVKWVDGGFELTAAQLNATTTPPGLDLVYDPPLGSKLQAGPATLKVSFPADGPAEGAPAEVPLTVDKAAATIAWDPPEPVQWKDGGFTPDETQLNAKTTPPGLKLVYGSDPKWPLPPGTHTLTAELDPEGAYEGKPAKQKLVVNVAASGLSWPTPPAPATAIPGGFVLSKAQFAGLLNPNNAELDYTPKLGTNLDVGKHTLSVRALDKTRYDQTALKVPFEVKKGAVAITWTPATTIPWVEAGITFDVDMLTATTVPPDVDLEYSLEVGSELKPGANKVKVSVDDPETFEGRPVTVTITVTQTDEQKAKAKHEQKVAATKAKGGKEPAEKRSKLTPEQEQAARELAAANLAEAHRLSTATVAGAVLNAEYPVGAGNKIPHIHSYPTGFHVKLLVGRSIKRFNVVQDRTESATAAEAMSEAWDYDVRTGSNVRKILQDLLKKFE